MTTDRIVSRFIQWVAAAYSVHAELPIALLAHSSPFCQRNDAEGLALLHKGAGE